MSKKSKKATQVAHLLEIKYAHALRLVRAVHADHEMGLLLDLADLTHACRELKEKEEKR